MEVIYIDDVHPPTSKCRERVSRFPQRLPGQFGDLAKRPMF